MRGKVFVSVSVFLIGLGILGTILGIRSLIFLLGGIVLGGVVFMPLFRRQ
jgi:hypothetical protein